MSFFSSLLFWFASGELGLLGPKALRQRLLTAIALSAPPKQRFASFEAMAGGQSVRFALSAKNFALFSPHLVGRMSRPAGESNGQKI